MIDLRSDTVTKPTEEMRKAMAQAEVGDDVYGEDPTVNELEKLAAKIFGKEDALFVPSGTMGNQVSIMAHTQRGDEVILEANSHIFWYEVGAMAVLSGVMPHPVAGKNGVMNPADVKRAIRPENIHFPRTSLITIENTHNRSGGRVIPLENMKEIYSIAKEFGINVHVDGARIFNASVASGISVKEYARYADSVMFCLSKGLCAPVGSVVVGDSEFIKKARKARKMLGGGMRQAGVLAAAGIIALTKMVDRLREDHENARFLATKLKEIGYQISPEDVETNMVILRTSNLRVNASMFLKELEENGVLASVLSNTEIRLVTHKDVSRSQIEDALNVFEKLFRKLS
ncbi:low-specificity L-threonine aldolase [Thermotoga sp. SG1]|uniref:low-specificity L-threonine aldolase n=1 Tax=Thermotoga sp. SG1 TaxID=126739 RepID=UPI000C78B3D1|nr:low-specificity L-threonine aldolase [Thermotoga sp. SG1]PLV55588.1 threonine aldolase [Thermotoga sp. SG1]